MKKIFIIGVAALVSGAFWVSCASSGGGGGGSSNSDTEVPGVWSWGTFTDAASQGASRISLIEDFEEVDGQILTTYNISGEISDKYQYGYAGWYAFPDDPTMEAMRSIKSFTFRVKGDGQTYFVMFCTSNIEDAAYYRTTFTTKKDQEITVRVRLGSLSQPEDFGARKPFEQNLATQIQFQTTNNGKPGTFSLKVYDLKLYQ